MNYVLMRVAHDVAGQNHRVSQTDSRPLDNTSNAPLLHIADCVSTHLREKYPHIKRVGLLGPKTTMLDSQDPDFFIGRLQSAQHGFTVLIPDGDEHILQVNRGMIEEVARGKACVAQSTKEMFVAEARALVHRGAQAIILGSTDLGFVFEQDSLPAEIPVIEPAEIHAKQVALWALKK